MRRNGTDRSLSDRIQLFQVAKLVKKNKHTLSKAKNIESFCRKENIFILSNRPNHYFFDIIHIIINFAHTISLHIFAKSVY